MSKLLVPVERDALLAKHLGIQVSDLKWWSDDSFTQNSRDDQEFRVFLSQAERQEFIREQVYSNLHDHDPKELSRVTGLDESYFCSISESAVLVDEHEQYRMSGIVAIHIQKAYGLEKFIDEVVSRKSGDDLIGGQLVYCCDDQFIYQFDC